MDRQLQQLMGQLGGGGGAGAAGGPASDMPTNDNSETIYISSLALLKMLKHGRAGVPLEVMGLMLGDFVDEFTVRVIDVFAMPQSGTGVSVEAVDPVFQTKMLDMLKQTGRPEMVVGWYHSHPGFGCWLSSVDVNTQHSFEQLNPRAVAVVVDPIQSVKGKVVIDAFRSINPQSVMMGLEPRQSTSNVGHLGKPSIQVRSLRRAQAKRVGGRGVSFSCSRTLTPLGFPKCTQALIHGLNRHYYSIAIAYRKTDLEQSMLLNLHKKNWTEGLRLNDWGAMKAQNEESIKRMLQLSQTYTASVKEEATLTPHQLKTRHVGKQDPKRHLEEAVEKAMGDSILQSLGTMLTVLSSGK
ncbi:BZ3500_MvSof-1268-A1-R1_Chr3-1g06082 [Microbotryum saponariae]|uniref:BZ3500_MvSof-1268-A1-R1_Chr3-1g06082 protein n=1 Tax=Microbotryum saponariae TaxID=289078 RepID=A0A2X0LDS8_9BASI|nr:BZ3500_MvSof-1268-A1-R1_Chr3-1g06082 [Microbotryum saponariae]SDA03929.1 BZ3501_MvSof-1269-A2-R1_Chr3-2g05767 [Microbotryum saponariae]